MRAAALGTTTGQPVTPWMSSWFLGDMVLVAISGFQLFILSESTDRYFAWTIQSPLTAAFLGAAYWCTLPMLFASFRALEWAHARIAVPGVWLFTVLTTLVTFQHIDRFHWNSPILTARLACWAWLIVYVAVPVGLGIAWYLQVRLQQPEPARRAPLQPWFRILLSVQAAALLVVGSALYFFPSIMIPVWAWTLTPLTSAAVGAWLLGIGLTLAWAVWENDWHRLQAMMLTYMLLGALQLVAVARYSHELRWGSGVSSAYLGFLIAILLVGGAGVWIARGAKDG